MAIVTTGNEMWVDILLLGGVVGSALALGISLICIVHLRRQLQLSQKRYQRLNRDLQVANSGAIGMGQRLLALERQFKAGASQREVASQPQQQAPFSYSQALSLFDAGTAVDEVARICGLSRGEASLMEVMHRHMQGQGSVAA